MGARIAFDNLLAVSGVVITSSSESLGYTDDYAASQQRWKKWRSAISAGDQWVKFDAGSNKSFQAIAAVSARVHTGGGTLKFQAHTSDSWGAPTVDQLVTIPSPDLTGVWVYWLPASQSLRWFRFYFTNTTAVSTSVELAVAWVSPYLEPTRGLSDGLEVTPIDPSVERRAISGARTFHARPHFHEFGGVFEIQS